MIDSNTIKEYLESKGYAFAMEACHQDPEWHAEGDVWTHTLMVVDALKSLDEFKVLDHNDQLTLLLVAFLHDMAKPDTTREIDGRIKSPGHSLLAAKQSIQILNDLKVHKSLYRSIFELIRYHGRASYFSSAKDS